MDFSIVANKLARQPIAFALAAMIAPTLLFAKSPHAFKGELETQARSNSNISLAPSSSSGFDFASLKEFDQDEDAAGADDEEDEDFGDIPDIDGSDYDELELAESDNPDEDGDGIDDLIDDDQDTGDGSDDPGDEDGVGIIGSKAAGRRSSSVERYTAKAGFAHKYQVSKTANYATSLKLALDKQPGRSDLDKLNFAFSTGPEFKLSDVLKLKTAVNYIRLQQDSEKFLSTWVGSVGLDWDVNKQVGLGFNYNYQNKDVTDPNAPDAIINTLTFNLDWALSKNDILKFKYSPTVEDSSITTRNKDNSGFEIAYSRKLPWNTVLGIGFKRDEVDYKKLATPRSDQINGFALQLETEFTDNLSGSLAFEERKLNSNINSKDGKNRSVVLGIGYKF
jgi:opacity protein-like surface antigen